MYTIFAAKDFTAATAALLGLESRLGMFVLQIWHPALLHELVFAEVPHFYFLQVPKGKRTFHFLPFLKVTSFSHPHFCITANVLSMV